MEIPKLRVMGLGAYPWYAKSGFCGVTAIFYASELKQTFNFSSSRPAETEAGALKEIEQMWRSKSAWNLAISLDAISKGELSLSGAKISEDGRLSSSEHTAASLLAPRTVLASAGGAINAQESAAETIGIFFDDFSKVKNLFSLDPDAPRTVYAVLKIARLGKGNFNKINQTYTAQLIDQFENTLSLSIKYAKISETAILNFEYMERTSIVPAAITVSVSISDENFEAAVFPVAVWLDGGIRNIGEEKLFAEKEKSEFAKYFEDDKK